MKHPNRTFTIRVPPVDHMETEQQSFIMERRGIEPRRRVLQGLAYAHISPRLEKLNESYQKLQPLSTTL